MALLLRCPNGHAWESASAESSTCPHCGSAAEAQEPTVNDRTGAYVPAGVGAVSTVDEIRSPLPVDFPPAIPAATLELPTWPGYEVLGVLGNGAMGIVYKARHCTLDRLVALKTIRSGAHAFDEERERFRAEALAVATLQHPNIVQIYEVGEKDGQPYCALEYIDGGSLDKKLRGKPLPSPEAAALLETLARAAHYAHLAGIVHRDLKPANILLSRDEGRGARGEEDPLASRPSSLAPTPKIADFGLAKRLDDNAGQTREGAVMGTPSYMAPEQAGQAREVGPTADVYALGAILYECLTGRPPFRAATLLETLEQVRNLEPLPPTRLQPKTPRDLETICLHCLHKEPGRRYASAAALADDLRRFLDGEPILARPTPTWERVWKWTRRRPALTSALAALATAVVLSYVLVSLATARAENEEKTLRNEERNEQKDTAKEKAARASAEAASLELLSRIEDTRRARAQDEEALYLGRMQLASTDWRDGTLGSCADWLDGCPLAPRNWEWHYLKRQSHTERMTWSSTGGAAYSPDNRHLAIAAQSGFILLCNAATGQQERVLRGDKQGVLSLAFSADNTRLASASRDGTIRIWDLASNATLRTLRGHTEIVKRMAWSPDGAYLVSSSREGVAILWNVQTGEEVFRRAGLNSVYGSSQIVFDPQGRWIAGAQADRSVQFWAVPTGEALFNLRLPVSISALAVSRDGQHLVAGGYGKAYVWDLPARRFLHSLGTDRGWVLGVALSPDGVQIAASGQNGVIRVCDLLTGARTQFFRGHSALTDFVEFSPDGRQFISTSWDQTARLWDRTFPRESHVLNVSQFGVTGVAFSPDGKHVAASVSDGMVKVWNAEDRREILTIPAHQHWALAVAYSSVGGVLASSGSDNATDDSELKLWDSVTGRLLFRLTCNTGDVYRLAFSSDGRLLASAGKNAAIVWDAATGKERYRIPNVTRAIAFSPDNRLLATLALAERFGDPTRPPLCIVKLFDAATGKPIRDLQGAQMILGSLAFSPDSRRIVAGGGDFVSRDEIHVWDVAGGPPLQSFSIGSARVMDVTFSPDSRRIVTADLARRVRLLDAATGRSLLSLDGHINTVTSVAFQPTGGLIASGSSDGTVRLWDGRPGLNVRAIRGTVGLVNTVAFSPRDRTLAVAGADHTINLWDITTARHIGTLGQHSSDVVSLAFLPGGKQVVSASKEGTVKVWDVETGRERFALIGHKNEVSSVAVNGTRLLTGGADQTARVWDAARGAEQLCYRGHSSAVLAVAFAPNGREALSVDAGGSVQLWDVGTGRARLTLSFPGRQARALAFSPDGKQFAVAGDSGEVKLWQAADGREVRSYRGHGEAVYAVTFSPDGRWIASAGVGYVVHVWEAQTGKTVHTLYGARNSIFSLAFHPKFSERGQPPADATRTLAAVGADGSLCLWEIPEEDRK